MNKARQQLRWSLIAIVALAGSASAAPPAVWQVSPYRIQVFVAIEKTPELAAMAGRLCAAITARCDALVGAPWAVTATLAEGDLREVLLAQPDRLGFELIPQAALDAADKVTLVGAGPTDGAYALWAREVDVRTRQLGPLVRLPVAAPGRIPDAAVEALFDVFRPLGVIQRLDKDRVQLSLRAATLVPRGPSLTPIGPDVAFQTWLPQPGAGTLTAVADAVLRVEKPQTEFTPAELESAAPVTLAVARGDGVDPLVMGTTARQRALVATPTADADEPFVRQAEAAALALDDDLTDLVAQREIVLAQARLQLAAGRTADAKASLAELRAMPTREQFTARVAAEQKKLTGGGATAQQRRESLFRELTQVAEKQLDAAPLAKLATNLEPPPPPPKPGDKKSGFKKSSR